MTSVLFDAPGPRTRARHRVITVVAGVAVAAVLALVLWKLWVEEAITPEKWSFLTEPNIVLALLLALLKTLLTAAAAIVASVVFGVVFAMGRLSDHAVLRWPSVAVVEFFRAVPLLLLIFFLFLAYGGILNTYGALILALMLYNGSVLAEVFRAGINAVPKGQREAAYAIGMRTGQVMRQILLPQGIRTMLPAIISQCVVALKDTTLGYIIGNPAFLREAEQIFVDFTRNNPIAVGLVVAATFILINYGLSRLAIYLESRMRRQGRRVVHVTDGTDTAGNALLP
jgi:glutamate transport system permease protein